MICEAVLLLLTVTKGFKQRCLLVVALLDKTNKKRRVRGDALLTLLILLLYVRVYVRCALSCVCGSYLCSPQDRLLLVAM